MCEKDIELKKLKYDKTRKNKQGAVKQFFSDYGVCFNTNWFCNDCWKVCLGDTCDKVLEKFFKDEGIKPNAVEPNIQS